MATSLAGAVAWARELAARRRAGAARPRPAGAAIATGAVRGIPARAAGVRPAPAGAAAYRRGACERGAAARGRGACARARAVPRMPGLGRIARIAAPVLCGAQAGAGPGPRPRRRPGRRARRRHHGFRHRDQPRDRGHRGDARRRETGGARRRSRPREVHDRRVGAQGTARRGCGASRRAGACRAR